MLTKLKNIEKLSERVVRILGCNPNHMTLQGTNTYLVGTGKSRLLIDTGDSNVPEYINNLKACLHVHESPLFIKGLVLTHWHHDHVGGIPDVIRDVVGSSSIPLYKYPRYPNEKPSDSDEKLHYTFLKDKQQISVEGATLEVIFTPGHSTDHVCLRLLEEDAIFSADCVLGEGTAVFEDLYDYMKSLQILLEYQPKVMYPGHGKVITDPVSHITHYMQHRNKRESQIFECIQKHDKPLTSMDIVKHIYTEVPEHLHIAAEKNVVNHLEKLLKEQKVYKDSGKWVFSSKM